MKVASFADDRPSFMRPVSEGLNVSSGFANGPYPGIKTLRKSRPNVPSVDYDAHFLATLDSWRGEARTFDPASVRATFERVQSQQLLAERPGLLDFLRGVEDRTIHSELHLSHFGVGR